MLLRDTLRDCTRSDLYTYSKDLGLKGCSTLKKDELIDKICEYLLGKGVMCSRLGILNDSEFDIFLRALESTISFKEFDEANNASEISDIGYLVMEEKRAFLPDDVKEAYLTNVKGVKFDTLRKTLSWIKMCLNFAEEMYGVVPSDQLVKLVNSRPGFDAGADEIATLYDVFPCEKKNMIYDKEAKEYISEIFTDEEKRKWLDEAQADKDFYTPNYRQIIALYKNLYLQDTAAYQRFKAFLNNKCPKNPDIVEDVITEVWMDLSADLKDYKEVIKWVLSYPELKLSDKDVYEVANILKDVNNSTRMLANRGFTPDELSKSDVKGPVPASAPTKKEKAMRKIYPNDPCPCGSGKKYKKCCGRK